MTNHQEPGTTVLLVDDMASRPHPLGDRLRRDARFQVTLADSPEALDCLLAGQPFDLVVSELRPWNRGHFWTLERVHAFRPQTPVVLVTARGNECLAVEAMKSGAADYLPASLPLDEIAERL